MAGPRRLAVVSLAAVISLIVLVVLFCIFVPKRKHPERRRGPSIALLVFGDLARSPRMLYHAQSCLTHRRPLWLVGYVDTPLPSELTSSALVRVVRLAPPPDVLARLPRLPQAFVKVAWMTCALCIGLFSLESPRYLLLQNPPSLPTLPVAQVFCLLKGTRLIIDWHNTGASVLALKFHRRHPLVRLATFLECTFGRSAHCHLFVTRAMLEHLSLHWRLRGDRRVLYDRPPKTFRRLDTQEIQSLLTSLVEQGHLERGDVQRERTALLVSSTSWTADEDFTILLRALSLYERAARQPGNSLPNVCAVVTGRGGRLHDDFVKGWTKRASSEEWRHVTVRTAWLSRSEYPRLLGAADLGISLHSSSSGFDLPMKVVDMFGCGLPVLALDFAACAALNDIVAESMRTVAVRLPELLTDGLNGRSFRSAEELADRLAVRCPQSSSKAAADESWKGLPARLSGN